MAGDDEEDALREAERALANLDESGKEIVEDVLDLIEEALDNPYYDLAYDRARIEEKIDGR